MEEQVLLDFRALSNSKQITSTKNLHGGVGAKDGKGRTVILICCNNLAEASVFKQQLKSATKRFYVIAFN